LGRIYIKKGNYHTASKYFLEIKNKYEDGVLGYSDVLMREASYYLGVNFMNKNNIDSAKFSFELCNKLSEKLDARNDEESGFQINGYLYLGKICANTNNDELAKKYYNKVLDMRDYRNSHDKVKRYLAKLEEKKKAGD
jgi:TolA-binding protein